MRVEGKREQTDMPNNSISYNVAVEGEIFHCPARLLIGTQNNKTVYGGVIQWGGRPISDAVEETDETMMSKVGSYVSGLLPECLPGELEVLHRDDITVIGFHKGNVYFKVAMAEDNTALLFAFQAKPGAGVNNDSSALLGALAKVADFFGIYEFIFYAQTKERWLFPALKSDDMANVGGIPTELADSSFLIYTHIVMKGDNIFISAVKELFSLNETEFYFGTKDKGFIGMIAIPSFDTPIMKSDKLCLMVQVDRELSFVLKGEFVFRFFPKMRFVVDCGISTGGFEIEALASSEEPVPVFGPFSVGETCLMIKMSEQPNFGVYTNLYIGKIRLFGAIMLTLREKGVEPQLLSAAISDLTIPDLLDNLLEEHIDGIEMLDFIRISGLSFENVTLNKGAIEQKNIDEIVTDFNKQVTNQMLNLDASQVNLTSFQGRKDMDLTDLKRMRQYHINESGKIQLMAQFYYAGVSTQFGSYTVEKGIFICARITIFNKTFDVLFSFRENEGLLAYAKIPNMDLGFLQIGPSKFAKENKDVLPIAKDSVLTQFVNPEQEGLIFFLSAGKKDISFYFDGSITLLKLFSVDARIVYCRGLISVDLCTVWLDILQVSLHLKVEYESFSTSNFSFCLMIDTSKLTEKLTKVTHRIETAIGKLRQKINDANREIDRAQAHVNELNNQIAGLNAKINDCKAAISHASWWKKAFVAVAKGAEICAYEVAKAGLYTAIGVATAALNVAKGLVNLSGKVSETVLKAVNGVIKGAMSLFYINYIKLMADADPNVQHFKAEIEFVALGKTYKLENEIINKAGLKASADNELSDKIINKMGNDLTDIENPELSNQTNRVMMDGPNRIEERLLQNNWEVFGDAINTAAEHCERLDAADEHIAAAVELMQSMQMAYIEEFETPMEEFDNMNVSLMDALSYVENVLSTGTQAGNVKELTDVMESIKDNVNNQMKEGIDSAEDFQKTQALIEEYDEARKVYDKVGDNLNKIRDYQNSMKAHCEDVVNATTAAQAVVIENDGNMEDVLYKVAENVRTQFPQSWSGKYFINLSKEEKIQESFRDAILQTLGEDASDDVRQKMEDIENMWRMESGVIDEAYQNRL